MCFSQVWRHPSLVWLFDPSLFWVGMNCLTKHCQISEVVQSHSQTHSDLFDRLTNHKPTAISTCFAWATHTRVKGNMIVSTVICTNNTPRRPEVSRRTESKKAKHQLTWAVLALSNDITVYHGMCAKATIARMQGGKMFGCISFVDLSIGQM